MIKVFCFLSITILMNLISIHQETGSVQQTGHRPECSKLLSNYPPGDEDGIKGLIERSAPNKTSIIKVKQSEYMGGWSAGSPNGQNFGHSYLKSFNIELRIDISALEFIQELKNELQRQIQASDLSYSPQNYEKGFYEENEEGVGFTYYDGCTHGSIDALLVKIKGKQFKLFITFREYFCDKIKVNPSKESQ